MTAAVDAVRQELAGMGLAPPRSLMTLKVLKDRAPNRNNRNLVDASVHVHFPAFYEQVLKIFKQVMKIAWDGPRFGSTISLLNHPGKSTEWMNALFVDFLKRTDLYDPATLELFDYAFGSWSEQPWGDPRARRPPTVPPTRCFVLLDDASYSGQQLEDAVNEFIDQFKRLPAGSVALVVAAAYATAEAVELVTSRMHFSEHPMFFVHGEMLTTLQDEGLAARIANKLRLFDRSRPRVPVVFDHKIPDDVSGYPGVYAGLYRGLPPDVLVPFYKNKNNADQLIQRSMLSLVKPNKDFIHYVAALPPPSVKRSGNYVRKNKRAPRAVPLSS